ncbi:MAG TPA: hypothetical protein VFW27_03485 [Actinoplanes sp.]|nr:hypothetical protein [Actinoplanes sp.]
MTSFIHDPDADLDYGFDWSPWLADGESLSASSWSVTYGTASEITLHDDTFDDTSTTVWVDGGTRSKDYKITNHITTSAGRADDRTHTLKVRDR